MLLGNPHLKELIFKDPYLAKKWVLRDNNILVRGTPGTGDFMFTMCTVFYIANLLKTKLNIIFYWNHDQQYEHHFEDPESIFEKIDYVHSICYKNELVTYEHVFDFDVDNLFRGEMLLNLSTPSKKQIGEKGKLTMPKGLNTWKFKPHIMNVPVIPKKITIWRFKFNAVAPPAWKSTYTNKHWDQVVQSLLNQGWSVTEIDYRTPIRESLWHMQRSELLFGYDGMWHYFARMLYKRTVITGNNMIVTSHNPQALCFFSPKIDKTRRYDLLNFVKSLDTNIVRLENIITKYISKVDHIIEN